MSSPSFARRACICIFALCCSPAALAQSIPVPHYDEEIKPDAGVPFPAPPKKENLLRFPTDWTTTEVYVDSTSLVIGDNTVSYTLLLRGAGGADNVTFESLRCDGARRVLAYGKRDGSWSPAHTSEWTAIRDARSNRYYFELWRDVFCRDTVVQVKRDIIIDIKRGGRVADYETPSQ
ncbi:MAG TPA: CNP1-like family protein [Burkholderiales bacterium]|jgi:hypothetical protein|nr:CNP1-like family protein [Burkholderiales bacterium]